MTTKDRLRERLHSLRKSLVRPYEKAKKKGDKVEMRRLEGLTAELDGVWERLEASAFGQLVADITALKLKIEGHALSGTGMISGISLDDLKDKIKEILSGSSEEDPTEGPGNETPDPVFPEPTDGEAPPPVDISPDVVIDDPGIADSGALILTEAHLIGLWKRSQFPIDGRGIVIFGLRGCRPVDFAGTDFAQAHEIALRETNYKTMNCTMGQWRPNGGLAVFPGSTVPFHTIVASKVGKRGVGVNQMGCGRYKNYAHGWHKRSEGPSGHWALRQECAITIQRTGDDTDYDLDDRWEVGRIAGDNIHCAFHMGADGAIPDSRFSSAGCQTIAGTVKKGVRASERGPWKKFIAPFQRDTGVQDSTEYVLFLAEEAQQMIRTRCAGKSVILRMGSAGPLVRQLQEVLSAHLARSIKVDGDFGVGTFQAVIDFQTDVFGNDADDGIVGPDTAEELGFTLPAFEFADAISGGPGFKPGTEVPVVTGETGSADSDGEGCMLAWGAVTNKKHGPAFKAKVIAIAKRLRADPDHLMAVMAFESGGKFTPDVKNAAGSGATGLIQFMPKTATSLGTSTKKLAKMTAIEQLDFVELYFKKTVGNRAMHSLSDVYMAVLWPKAVGKSENFILFEKGTTAYRQNAGLDKNRDGFIRKAEAAAKVFDKLVLGQKEGRLG
ncbi:MAG: transglycosylase SLT domain-containing protein [Hyphomicrobiales bacterium]|nr:transglycosylase SLT domain-containing protein [Hyphomicrobiales bacterium]MCP5001472.1 transglycosylase SLT domain-containing protein [Hyphomicrobiales bacterium]